MERVLAELRAEEPPEPSWDALEARLEARLDAAEKAQAARRAARRDAPASGFAGAMMFAAAAAFVVLGMSLSTGDATAPAAAMTEARREVDVASAARLPGDATAHDLAALAVGDVITAGSEAVTFALPGAVRWTLAPGGRAIVKSTGRRGMSGPATGQVLDLEEGSLRAEVTPAAPAAGIVETFSVTSGLTRVAVHGTVFRVTRSGAELVVDLEHGSVVVGPAGHIGPAAGHVLMAPARAAFSLDGARSARFLDADEIVGGATIPAATAAAAPAAIDAGAPSVGRAERAPAQAREAPTASPAPTSAATVEAAHAIALSRGGVQQHLAGCFERTYGPLAAGASVVSTLTLSLRDDGSVSSARFDPPLRPDFQACAWVTGRFVGERGTLTIPVQYRR